jgi:hypothetical protein
MAKPATRGELKKAVAPLATKKALERAIALLATKEELAKAIAPLATREEMHQGFSLLLNRMDAMFTAQSKELARHVQAVLEEVRSMIRAVDDKYADLPGRVSRLEDERGH